MSILRTYFDSNRGWRKPIRGHRTQRRKVHVSGQGSRTGRPPRKRELPRYSAVIYRFGSWSVGLRLAGFEKKKSPKRTLWEKQEGK
ncbi:homing endonuclease associated repeat-containing protein [Hazenella coriacea]|uniref:homing endonuclease associated repeat-containing protein n=1 Tax=Hazenella coriacea TaxID=1179467 RepID=UPI003C77EFD8